MALITEQNNTSIFRTKFSTAGGFIVVLLGLAILSLVERILYDAGRLLAPAPLDYFNNFTVISIHAAVVLIFLAIAFFANIFLGERRQKYAMALVPYFVVSILVALQLVLQVSIYFSYHHTNVEFYLVISALTIVSTLLMYLAQKRFVTRTEAGEHVSEPSAGAVIGFVILFIIAFCIAYQFESGVAQNAQYQQVEIQREQQMMQQQKAQQAVQEAQQNPNYIAFTGQSGAYYFAPEDYDPHLVGRWTLTNNQQNGYQNLVDSAVSSAVNVFWSPISNQQNPSAVQGVYYFNGNDSHFVVAPSPSLTFANGSTITLTAWIRPKTLTGLNTILNKDMSEVGGNKTNYGFRVGQTMGKEKRLEFYYAGTNGEWQEYVSNADAISTNVWQNVVATYTFGKADSVKLYLNGNLLPGTWDRGDGTQPPTITNDTLFIGAINAPDNSQVFDGLIADVHIYNRALSMDEIKQFYSQTKLPEGTFN